jgi:hypothetical protein
MNSQLDIASKLRKELEEACRLFENLLSQDPEDREYRERTHHIAWRLIQRTRLLFLLEMSHTVETIQKGLHRYKGKASLATINRWLDGDQTPRPKNAKALKMLWEETKTLGRPYGKKSKR